MEFTELDEGIDNNEHEFEELHPQEKQPIDQFKSYLFLVHLFTDEQAPMESKLMCWLKIFEIFFS